MRTIETVVRFEAHPNIFQVDPTVSDKLKQIARMSTRPGPISINNPQEVGKERMSKMKINELELTDVSGGFECDLFNYGKMRESLGCFNYKFTPGVYGVRTEFGKGGWALTEILAGRYSDFSGTIQADGQILTATQLKRYTCYVGADLNWDIKLGLRKKTIHNQIKYAINNGLGFGKSIDELKKCLNFQREDLNVRLNKQAGNVGAFRWL